MHASPLARPVPWGRGQLLAFSAVDGPTALARDLVGRTMPDGLDIVMPGRLSLHFPAPPVAATFAGDWFTVESPAGAVRGVLLDHAHLLLDGVVRIVGADPALAVRARAGRTLIGSAAAFVPGRIDEDLDAAMARRQAWMRRMLARLPAELAGRPIAHKVLALMKTQVCSPEGAMSSRWTTPDRWPHQHAWLWDSAFHGVGWRHLDPALALEQLGAVLGMQGPDGFIPHRLGPDGGSDITQPPILAWGAAEVLALHPDRAWLDWAYPRLCRFVDWMMSGRRTDGGLLAWRTTSIETCRCDESGWDNSPRFDRGPSPMAVDLNAFLARECRVLADLALGLGRAAEAARWETLGGAIAAQIDSLLWDERSGLYGDRGAGEDSPRPLRTPAGLLPLLHGLVPAARAARMARTLADPAVFGTPMPLPSVAMADLPGLSASGDMWRGPVWININHQVVRGLQAIGLHDVAGQARSATLAAMERWHARCGGIFEFYDPLDRLAPPDMPRKGRNDPSSPYHQVIHDFGWSATCWLDLACAPEGTARSARS